MTNLTKFSHRNLRVLGLAPDVLAALPDVDIPDLDGSGGNCGLSAASPDSTLRASDLASTLSPTPAKPQSAERPVFQRKNSISQDGERESISVHRS